VRAVSHSVVRTVDAPVERVFDVVVAEDVLPKVLHRWGLVPAVTGTRDLTGPWDRPGSERTVVLGDGHTVRERVLIWQRPRLFEYVVDEFTGPFGRLADHAIGTWRFQPTPAGSQFRWTYSFQPRGLTSAALLVVVVRTAWTRYMEKCATLCAGLALDSGPANQ
jgi:Polyketide cyclase / dehydrase and lipid transport